MADGSGKFTHFDIPGICTHGPRPVPGQDIYDSPMLTAPQLRELANPAKTYCLHFGSTRTIHDGADLAGWAGEPQYGPALYLNHLHEVPGGTPQRTQDLWMLNVGPDTGEITVHDHPTSVWDIEDLRGPVPERDHSLREEARSLAALALENRRAERDFSNEAAMREALEIAEDGAVNSLSRNHREFRPQHGEGPVPGREWFTMRRIEELLDPACNAARIRMAGIDLDQHPELHTFAHFYRLGCKPPSHEEMADHAIRTLGNA